MGKVLIKIYYYAKKNKTKQEAEADLSYITVAGAAVCVTALAMHNFFSFKLLGRLRKSQRKRVVEWDLLLLIRRLLKRQGSIRLGLASLTHLNDFCIF